MLGVNIKMGMAKVGINVLTLSKEMEVSRQTVSSWINNKSTPSPENQKKLCERFGVSLSKFVGWTE